VTIEQGLEGNWREKRDIPGKQDDISCSSGQCRGRGQERMPGPELWLLHHKSETWLPCECPGDRFRLVSDDHGDGPGAKGASARENVRDHGQTGHAVQHFGVRRLQARPLAGREDDHMDVRHRPSIIV
jgi:hypothetical protein